MNTLITFLNVCAVGWVAIYTLITASIFWSIKTQSTLHAQLHGRYDWDPNPYKLASYLLSIAWLITGHIESLEEIEPQTETVEIEILDTQSQLELPAVLIFEEAFNEQTNLHN